MSDWDDIPRARGEWDDLPLVTPRVVKRQMDTELARNVERARKVGVPEDELSEFFNPPNVSRGTWPGPLGDYQEYMAGGGKLIRNAKNALAQLFSGNPEKANAQAREDLRLQERGGLNDSTWANVGEFAFGAAPYALGMGPLMRMGPVAAGVTEAAYETLTTPEAGEDALTDKAKRFGINLGIGVGGNKGADILADVYSAGRNAPSAVIDFMERPASGDPIVRADPAALAEGNRLASSTGVGLTPFQRGGAPAAGQMEQFTRESLITRGKVARGDETRNQQLEAALDRYVQTLGPGAPREVVAQKVQAFVEEQAKALQLARREQADIDYRPIVQYANGAPVISAPTYLAELKKIVREGSTAGAGEDAVAAARQAQGRLERLAEQKNRLTGRDVDLLTRAGGDYGGTVFEVIDRGYGSELTDRLRRAATADAMAIPGLDTALTIAKENYKANSRAIEALEMSGLGKIVGEQFASDIVAMQGNKISPAQVFQKLWNQDPTDFSTTIGYLDRNSPEIANQLRRAFVETAVKASKAAPASGGTRTSIDPGSFLRTLGIRGSDEARMLNLEKIDALFGGTTAEPLMRDIIETARRLADTRYANRSGTDIRAETRDWINQVSNLFQATWSIARKSAGTGLSIAGLRGYADRMDPLSRNFLTGGPRYQMSPLTRQRVTTLPPIPAMIASQELLQDADL